MINGQKKIFFSCPYCGAPHKRFVETLDESQGFFRCQTFDDDREGCGQFFVTSIKWAATVQVSTIELHSTIPQDTLIIKNADHAEPETAFQDALGSTETNKS